MNNCCICWFSRIFLLGILIFKRLTARRLYKSFGVKGLNVLVLQSRGLATTRTPFSSPAPLSVCCSEAPYKVPTISSRRIRESSISTRITTIDSSRVDISVTSLEAIVGLFSFVCVCARARVCMCFCAK
jgi:hypothetical protein